MEGVQKGEYIQKSWCFNGLYSNIPGGLFEIGYLAYKSRFVPRIFGIWLIIGGIAYGTQAVLFYVSPNFDAMIFGLFAFAGEFLFYLWLLIRGMKTT